MSEVSEPEFKKKNFSSGNMSRLDCKSIFAYCFKNAIGFEKRSIWAIIFLKQNFLCFHVSLWHLYPDHFFCVCPFSGFVWGVCECVHVLPTSTFQTL